MTINVQGPNLIPQMTRHMHFIAFEDAPEKGDLASSEHAILLGNKAIKSLQNYYLMAGSWDISIQETTRGYIIRAARIKWVK